MVAPGVPRGGRGIGLALSGLALLLVVVEFLLGMWVNLYDTLPPSLRAAFESPYVTQDQALVAHIVVGVLLGVVAVALVAWAALRHRPRLLGVGVGGLLGVLIAAGGGSEFLSTGDPIYSFLMALGFLMAMGAYFRGVHSLTRPPRGAPGGWATMGGAPPAPPAS